MPVATDDIAICTSGMCGFRRFIPGIDGFDGFDGCAALRDDHDSGLHNGRLGVRGSGMPPGQPYTRKPCACAQGARLVVVRRPEEVFAGSALPRLTEPIPATHPAMRFYAPTSGS
jgi:hypothetical protein